MKTQKVSFYIYFKPTVVPNEAGDNNFYPGVQLRILCVCVPERSLVVYHEYISDVRCSRSRLLSPVLVTKVYLGTALRFLLLKTYLYIF